MNQLYLNFYNEQKSSIDVTLSNRTQEEIIRLMARLIIAFYKKGGIKNNDKYKLSE